MKNINFFFFNAERYKAGVCEGVKVPSYTYMYMYTCVVHIVSIFISI